MAQKRMFDRSIIEVDEFMDMPMSTKALYFLLGMEADDEGFVSPNRVMRIYGGGVDDLKVLVAKGFVLQFKSGVVVITDWKENNYLDKNRIKETRYKAEKALLSMKNNKYLMLNECLTSIEENSIEENRRENTFSNENELSYEEPLKETYKTKSKIYKQLGINYKPKEKSSAQEIVWNTELLARYLQEKEMELHRKQVYIKKSESGKGWKALRAAIKEFGLEETKKMVDFYLTSEKYDKFGSDVATMFSEHSINSFFKGENKKIIKQFK